MAGEGGEVTRAAAVAPGIGARSGAAGSSWTKGGKAQEDLGGHGDVRQPGLQGMGSAWPWPSWVSLGKLLPFSSQGRRPHSSSRQRSPTPHHPKSEKASP